MTVRLRVPTAADAEALAALLTRNRDHFRSGEPLRPDEFYTPGHQARVVAEADEARRNGTGFMFLVEDDGDLVGRADLSSVIRGAFQSASVGCLVDEARTGRGVAKATVRALVGLAFGELGLHRLQGEVLVDNAASRRVLEACGFVRYGSAPDYLRIDGRWRSCDLYQIVNEDWAPLGD